MGDATARQAVAAGHDSADSLPDLGRSLATLIAQAGPGGGVSALEGLLRFGQTPAVGARWGSVVRLRQGRFHTVASTGETAAAIDRAQIHAGQGPAIEVVLHGSTVLTADITDDERWQPLGQRLQESLGVRSMVAYRLHLLDESDAVAGLCFSSDRAHAFSPHHVHRGLLIASHAALMLTAHTANTNADQLSKALDSNREIGVGVGVLMASHSLTREQAFQVLRTASQNTNRKLRDIAIEVGDTGLPPSGGDPGRD
ncbi:GAF and ANTAR domain-containing protein [Oryzobacter telluris]|uniref:GAF and ANTAR domain-containing protein n=1 Tax=Oryzobacter telluris TaxID=3149179 RepID=UPI00370D0638